MRLYTDISAWITITGGASMTGLGLTSYSVAATAASRTGTFIVAGQSIVVTQNASGPPPLPPANLRIIAVVR